MEKSLQTIKEYWFMIVFIGMVVVSWATFSLRLDDVEKRVADLERAYTSFEQIKIDIAVIKNDVTTIKQSLQPLQR